MKNDKKSSFLIRKERVKKKVRGTAERPRLAVHKTLKHLYLQVVDDVAGKTLASVSSMDKELKGDKKVTNNLKGAEVLGGLIAMRAVAAGVKNVVFDRSGFKYHGKVAKIAEKARENGLIF